MLQVNEHFDSSLLDMLACPVDHKSLHLDGGALCCTRRHRYPIFRGIPVLLVEGVRRTADWFSPERLIESGNCSEGDWRPSSEEEVHPAVQAVIAQTNGNLYRALVGKLAQYPIPEIRLPNSNGKRRLLDIGCNWGRWTVAAARKGYSSIGLDFDLAATITARIVATQLGCAVSFVCGDARYLPFRNGGFDRVFSFSVVQHFEKADARATLAEIRRCYR